MTLAPAAAKNPDDRVKTALDATFAKRATHEMPKKLAAPPAEWKPVFEALASECGLNMDLRTGFETAQRFLDAI